MVEVATVSVRCCNLLNPLHHQCLSKTKLICIQSPSCSYDFNHGHLSFSLDLSPVLLFEEHHELVVC